MTRQRRFRGLSARQHAAFERVAIGDDRFLHPETARALLRRGLVESEVETLSGWPPVTITRYYVPLPVHMEWCEWCSEQSS